MVKILLTHHVCEINVSAAGARMAGARMAGARMAGARMAGARTSQKKAHKTILLCVAFFAIIFGQNYKKSQTAG